MFDWFSGNFLKANADKRHLIASSKVPVEGTRYKVPVPDIQY